MREIKGPDPDEITKAEFVGALLMFTGAVVVMLLVALLGPGCTGWTPTNQAPVAIPSSAVGPGEPATAPGSCCALAWGLKDGVAHKGVDGTGYYPDSSALEGGFNNRYGQPLSTLQGFLTGRAAHVSVAIDRDLGKTKRKICSPQLNTAFGKPLKLLVEDTGGAFNGKGWTRVDICTASYKDSLNSVINGKFDLIECVP